MRTVKLELMKSVRTAHPTYLLNFDLAKLNHGDV